MAMMFSRLLLCLSLSLFSIGYATESTDEKTTEAVMKAVAQAESAPKSQDPNELIQEVFDSKKAVKREEGLAAAKASTEVLESEGHADETVSQEVLDRAAANAKKTFKEMSDGGVGSKAAAAAAAEVAAATVDGASDLSLTKEAKENAEKAAVAAAEGVADHPHNEGSALAEAVGEVKKDEKTPGKVDLTEEPKGVVDKATAAVSNLPKLAEGAVEEGKEAAENMVGGGGISALGVFVTIAFFGGAFAIGKKILNDQYENTPYMMRLNLIREEFNAPGGADGTPDLETQYRGFEEMTPY